MRTLLVLSGGVALGAYQAGACAALHQQGNLAPAWIAGSSIGAVNASLLAGSPPETRVACLEAFWEAAASGTLAEIGAWPALLSGSPLRQGYSWLSVLQARLFGLPALFQLRPPWSGNWDMASLYDFTPMRAQLTARIDFERLNRGPTRLTVAATDLQSGEPVLFDTARGQRIGPDHLLASCGLPPDFPGVEIDGRLLGDGGLAANAPVAPVLQEVLEEEAAQAPVLCFVVDLFCAEGRRPATLQEATGRRLELLFGNQTRLALDLLGREYRLRATLDARRRPPPVTVLYLAYRPAAHERGAERIFDFSRAALHERWQAGYGDMEEALRLAHETGAPEARGERGVQCWRWA